MGHTKWSVLAVLLVLGCAGGDGVTADVPGADGDSRVAGADQTGRNPDSAAGIDGASTDTARLADGSLPDAGGEELPALDVGNDLSTDAAPDAELPDVVADWPDVGIDVKPADVAADVAGDWGPEIQDTETELADAGFDLADLADSVSDGDLAPDDAWEVDVAPDLEADVPEVCVPDCDGKECGGDGCQGSCGACPLYYNCQENQCVCPAGPCGEICCGAGYACTDGKCHPEGTQPKAWLSLGEVTTTSAEIYMENEVPIANYELWFSGSALTAAGGGSTEDAGLNLVVGQTKLMAFDMDGNSVIEPGTGLLLVIEFEPIVPPAYNFCISNLSFIDDNAQPVDVVIWPQCFYYL